MKAEVLVINTDAKKGQETDDGRANHDRQVEYYGLCDCRTKVYGIESIEEQSCQLTVYAISNPTINANKAMRKEASQDQSFEGCLFGAIYGIGL